MIEPMIQHVMEQFEQDYHDILEKANKEDTNILRAVYYINLRAIAISNPLKNPEIQKLMLTEFDICIEISRAALALEYFLDSKN